MANDIFIIGKATISRTQFRLLVGVPAALVIAGMAITPFADTSLTAITAYLSTFGAIMIVANLLLTAPLFSKAIIDHRGAAARLDDAFPYFTHMLFLPPAGIRGALTTAPLVGSNQAQLGACGRLAISATR